MENSAALVSGRKNYSWNNKPSVDCIKERNQILRTLVSSRKVINGGVDVETLDKVTSGVVLAHFHFEIIMRC